MPLNIPRLNNYRHDMKSANICCDVIKSNHSISGGVNFALQSFEFLLNPLMGLMQ